MKQNLTLGKIIKWIFFGFLLNFILTMIFLQGLVNFNSSYGQLNGEVEISPISKVVNIPQRLKKSPFMDSIFIQHYNSSEKLNTSKINSRNIIASSLSTLKTKLFTKSVGNTTIKPPLIFDKSKVLDILPTNTSRFHDRILEQLDYKEEVNNSKLILLYAGKKSEDMVKAMETCEIKNCRFTINQNLQPKADAVVFNSGFLRITPSLEKPMGQVWLFSQLESPVYRSLSSKTLREALKKFNFTATYRRDSVIVTPYEKFVSYAQLGQKHRLKNLVDTKKNYATNKTKMVAWFVSNCRARNGRHKYVEELQKYIQVDIYGRCGPMNCSRKKAADCFDKLNKDYKFYLAFENSNCVDYITEKLYWNGFNNDVVPIVMGARPEDYDAVVPPNSVIHVDHFESPKHLADYLKLLNENDDLYNSYYKWKGTGEFINTKMWCRLCALLHATEHQKVWVEDLKDWWEPKGVCVAPNTIFGKKWSTWRNITEPIKFPSLKFS